MIHLSPSQLNYSSAEKQIDKISMQNKSVVIVGNKNANSASGYQDFMRPFKGNEILVASRIICSQSLQNPFLTRSRHRRYSCLTPATLFKKENLAQVFSWEFCQIIKNIFSAENLRATLFVLHKRSILFFIALCNG